MEDLKRLNNIHKENEIFAKAVIKVPSHPISMALAGVHSSGSSSPNRQQSATVTVDSQKVATSLQEAEVNEIIFNSNIVRQNTSSIIQSNSDFDDDDETVNLLPGNNSVRDRPPIITFSGTDGDLSPKALIICIVVLIVLIPLFYVFYIYEHPKSFHGQDS